MIAWVKGEALVRRVAHPDPGSYAEMPKQRQRLEQGM